LLCGWVSLVCRDIAPIVFAIGLVFFHTMIFFAVDSINIAMFKEMDEKKKKEWWYHE